MKPALCDDVLVLATQFRDREFNLFSIRSK